ncbi:MAG TPA: ATP-dependent DNA helicase RecG [Actinopolymorphaceae bacterium]
MPGNPLEESVGVLLAGKTAATLRTALDIETVEDLLRHFPRRYLERGELSNIHSLVVGEHVSLVARIVSVRQYNLASRPGTRTVLTVSDGRETLEVTFFNQRKWFADKMKTGKLIYLAGNVTTFARKLTLTHPQWELLDVEAAPEGALGHLDMQAYAESMPTAAASPFIRIYPATKDITTRQIATAVTTVLSTLHTLDDPIPAAVRQRHDLPDLLTAYRLVHHPQTVDDYEAGGRRFAFEEALVLQTELARRRRQIDAAGAQARTRITGGLLDAFDAGLPFVLTDGQRMIGEQLFTELGHDHPMHRLLQGEVGSGKTVIAARAMLAVVDAGGQAALLAPTEVLATQHARSIGALLGPLGRAGELGSADGATRLTLLTGSMGTAARRRALADIASGVAGIVIGTHALLEDRVQFADLGLVVVDEQHRFGVEQRSVLTDKATSPDGREITPHLLVMTATPIPRTIAMTVFGDLDMSSLTELPLGRSPIQTSVVPTTDHPAWLDRAWQRVAEEVRQGRQAYVVCPRIDSVEEEDEPIEYGKLRLVYDRDAERRAELDALAKPRKMVALLDVLPELRQREELRGLRIEAMHGRLPPEEKDAIMQAFTAGQIDVLVATTVIEVGVDVANATVMVVMDADRFGVSQLHQLRGRVGRGEHPGLCLFVTPVTAELPAAKRLMAVAATDDGSVVSRIDLEYRQEGDVLGAAQSGGTTALKYLSVLRDEDLIVAARDEAAGIVRDDPDLTTVPGLRELVRALESDASSFMEKT